MKTAVLLFNLGGPRHPKEIKPFLHDMFRDPAILPGSKWKREILSFIISTLRAPASYALYERAGGGSTLLEQTKAQARALEAYLCRYHADKGEEWRSFAVMRYGADGLSDIWADLLSYAPDQIVALPLYPQFSNATSGSSLRQFDEKLKEETNLSSAKILTVRSYPDQKDFIAAWCVPLLAAYQEAMAYGVPRILLVAHGLPESMIRRGDPYEIECERTALALKETLSLGLHEENLDIGLAYQSKIGIQKWLGPSVLEEIRAAAKETKPIILAPVSFVSEHVETEVELDQEAKEIAISLGCPYFKRVLTPGTQPLFIQALGRLVKETAL